MEFQPEHILDVKRIDHLFAKGRDHGRGDIDVVGRQGPGEVIEQAGTVAGVHLDDRVDFRAIVIKGDMRGHAKGTFAFLELVAGFDRLAGDDFALQCLLDHVAQARQAVGLEGMPIGVLYPEHGRRKAVLGGIGARVHHIGPHQRQRTSQPREDARMIGQRETGTGRVAILVNRQINCNLILVQIVQKAGKDHMRGDMQPLPIGRIMARGFVLEVLGIPTGQRLAQVALGIRAALFAVEILKPAFHGAAGLAVEGTQERRLPVVPGAGADTANIANGEQEQQVKPLARLHRLGEITHGAGIGNVAFLRHVGHE